MTDHKGPRQFCVWQRVGLRAPMLSDRWIDDDLGPFIYREMVVEKSAYDKVVEALKKFADEDFRGNRPGHCVESYNLLKELGEL